MRTCFACGWKWARLRLLLVLRLFLFCFVYLLLIALADVGLGERDFSPLPSRTESWLVWTIISHHDKTALDYLFPQSLALHNCCSSMPMLIQFIHISLNGRSNIFLKMKGSLDTLLRECLRSRFNLTG
jgi:hypothetical protein